MAFIEIGNNLLESGNQGTFERELSSWDIMNGGGMGQYIQHTPHTLEREEVLTFDDSEASAKISYLKNAGLNQYQNLITFASWAFVTGKKYKIKGWVYIPGTNPIGNTGSEIYFHTDNSSAVTITEKNRIVIGEGVKVIKNFSESTTQLETLNTWIELYCVVECIGSSLVAFVLRGMDEVAHPLIEAGNIYLDKVEVYEAGDENELDIENVFCKNPIPVVVSSANAFQENFRYELDLFIKESDEYKKVLSLKGYPSINGDYSFNLKRSVLSYLEADLPAFNQTSITYASKAVKRFYSVVREFYGNPIEEKGAITSPLKNGFYGGLSFVDWPGNTFFNMGEVRPFLTHQAPVKKVTRTQQEFLHFLADENFTFGFWLYGKIYFTDGTTLTTNLKFSASAKDKVAIIPAGFAQLGIATLAPSKTVKKYTLWCGNNIAPDAATHTTEERTFILDDRYFPTERFFLFQNSFGFMEVVRFTGKFESSIEIDGQEAELTLPYQYDPTSDSEFIEYNTSFTRKFKANSGHLTSQEKMNLVDFLVSENRFELLKNRFVRIILQTDKHKILKDLEYMNSIEFDYIHAHSNPAFSDL
jgi:hypothetical protein